MRPRPFTELFMLRLSQEEKERLQKVADELGINCAQLASFYPPGRQSGLWQADADYRVCGVILCRSAEQAWRACS
jgi:hypothetical protein